MKLLLLSDNPVVNKLVTLSAQKTGDELVAVTALGEVPAGRYDLLVVDEGLYNANVVDELSVRTGAWVKLFMAPHGAKVPDGFEYSLSKPFLPTDLVKLFVSIDEELSTHDVELSAPSAAKPAEPFAFEGEDEEEAVTFDLPDLDALMFEDDGEPAFSEAPESLDALETLEFDESGLEETNPPVLDEADVLEVQNLLEETADPSLADEEEAFAGGGELPAALNARTLDEVKNMLEGLEEDEAQGAQAQSPEVSELDADDTPERFEFDDAANAMGLDALDFEHEVPDTEPAFTPAASLNEALNLEGFEDVVLKDETAEEADLEFDALGAEAEERVVESADLDDFELPGLKEPLFEAGAPEEAAAEDDLDARLAAMGFGDETAETAEDETFDFGDLGDETAETATEVEEDFADFGLETAAAEPETAGDFDFGDPEAGAAEADEDLDAQLAAMGFEDETAETTQSGDFDLGELEDFESADASVAVNEAEPAEADDLDAQLAAMGFGDETSEAAESESFELGDLEETSGEAAETDAFDFGDLEMEPSEPAEAAEDDLDAQLAAMGFGDEALEEGEAFALEEFEVASDDAEPEAFDFGDPENKAADETPEETAVAKDTASESPDDDLLRSLEAQIESAVSELSDEELAEEVDEALLLDIVNAADAEETEPETEAEAEAEEEAEEEPEAAASESAAELSADEAAFDELDTLDAAALKAALGEAEAPETESAEAPGEPEAAATEPAAAPKAAPLSAIEGVEALKTLVKALENEAFAKSLKGMNISINITFGAED